jgi:hypothetical protein
VARFSAVSASLVLFAVLRRMTRLFAVLVEVAVGCSLHIFLCIIAELEEGVDVLCRLHVGCVLDIGYYVRINDHYEEENRPSTRNVEPVPLTCEPYAL